MADNLVPSNSTPIPMEYPKRMTAINETTGALIKTRTSNQTEYAKGWDAIFGKPAKECDTQVTEVLSV